MKISSTYLFSLAYQYINQVNYFGSSYIKREIKKEVNYQYIKKIVILKKDKYKCLGHKMI